MMAERNRQGDLDAELTLVRVAVEHPEAVVPILAMVRPDQLLIRFPERSGRSSRD